MRPIDFLAGSDFKVGIHKGLYGNGGDKNPLGRWDGWDDACVAPQPDRSRGRWSLRPSESEGAYRFSPGESAYPGWTFDIILHSPLKGAKDDPLL
jgi:hypothetical protein